MQTPRANIVSPHTEGLPSCRQGISESPCGSGFASCVLFIAALLFGFNAHAAQLPADPVIFIHGQNSSALTWAEPGSSFKDFLITNGGWIFGGSPTYDANTKKVTGILGSGDFYTLNFSNNPNSGFDVNGSELSAIIQGVLSANPGMGKVILVAHSMGGLAAREYLQSLSTDYDTLQGIPYRGDVYKLITVGTPHQVGNPRPARKTATGSPLRLSKSFALYNSCRKHATNNF